ncbi:MAG: hypothetical protein WDN45_02560 [Caulobacteraceae bacterium]
MTIDNGNHLVLSGNRAVQAYLKRLGASGRLAVPSRPSSPSSTCATAPADHAPQRRPHPLVDLPALPRRVPGTTAADYARAR